MWLHVLRVNQNQRGKGNRRSAKLAQDSTKSIVVTSNLLIFVISLCCVLQIE